MHLVTGSYFRSRNEDGGHAIRSAVAECCAARKLHRFMWYRSELLVDKFNARESGYVLQRGFTKFGEITQNKKYYARSFKVTDFGTNRKLMRLPISD